MPTRTQSSILENSIREAQEAYDKIPRKFQANIDQKRYLRGDRGKLCALAALSLHPHSPRVRMMVLSRK